MLFVMRSDPPTANLRSFKDGLPDLYDRGVALWETQAHVNELAWHRDDAFTVVKALAEAGRCILGGDVWEIDESGHPRPSHANWYYEPTAGLDDGPESCSVAIRYIQSYESGDRTLFSLVWR
jgi:hypothetical protein